MEAVILYFGKVIVCSGVMFLYYQLSLKDKTFHHYNRFYLLGAVIVSLLLPLIKVEDFTIEVNNDIYVLISKLQNFNSEKTTDNDYLYFRIIFSAFGLVSLYFLGKLLYGIIKIQQFKKQFQKENFDGINFYQTNLSEAPFSYFKNLFWKNTLVINSDVGKQILKHEMVHIEQKHSYDKIFMEIITSVFWFNPFFHIIKKEISLIHEYLADKKAVKQSDTKAFAQMLLASHFSGTQLPATSPFLSSNLKKRLKMLQKPQTKFGYARRIFALPVIFTVAFAYMVNAKNQEITETNKEIEKAVSEIKKDTLAPKNNIDQIVKKQEEKISKANEKLKIQSEKLKTLSEKSKEKAEELKKIAKEKGEESYDFELKAKELKQLTHEMERVVEKDFKYQIDFDRAKVMADFPKANFDRLELNKTYSDGRAYRMKMDEIDFDKIFDSKEFRENSEMTEEKIKELKQKFNSPEFKEQFKKLKFEGPNVVYHNNSPRFEIDSYLTDTSKLSKKEARRLSKLAKEKAELNQKQAEIARKKAEITREQSRLQGNPWMISVDAHAPAPGANYTATSGFTKTPKSDRVISIEKSHKQEGYKNVIESNFERDTKIYIDGKLVSKSEFDSLDQKTIDKVRVNTSMSNGKKTGEILVYTKSK